MHNGWDVNILLKGNAIYLEAEGECKGANASELFSNAAINENHFDAPTLLSSASLPVMLASISIQ